MLIKLNQLNPHIHIFSIHDEAFLKYGKVLTHYDFQECIHIVEKSSVPENGNMYLAKEEELMGTGMRKILSEEFYGGMPIQIGICNGNNSSLNALEYHKGSEIDVAVTDLILLLGDVRNIKDNQLSSSTVEAFYLPKGTACELYGTTLHFAPCKLSDSGFKSMIVLPDGTNGEIETKPTPSGEEDKLLWMKNKWLIAHEDSIPASKGAFIGITGDNITINYK